MTTRTPSHSSQDAVSKPRQHRAWRLLGVVGLGAYFVAGTLLLAGRWFFTTQVDNFRDDITALSSELLGVQVNAEKITGSFSQFWPTLTLEKVHISQPGTDATLDLPKVEARFSWSTLWALEPRFQVLQITAPSLSIHRTGENTYEVAGWHLDLNQVQSAQPSGNKTADFCRWLLAQTKLSIIDGDVTYQDETNPDGSVVRLTDIQFLFEQRLLEWRAAFRARRLKETGEENVHLIGAVEKDLLHNSADPLTWKGAFYAKTDFVDVAQLVKKLKLPLALSSGTGAIEFWSHFQDGHFSDIVSDMDVQGVNVQLPNAQEPLDVKRLVTRLTYGNVDSKKTGQLRTVALKDLVLRTSKEGTIHDNRLALLSAAEETRAGSPTVYKIDISEANLSNWKRLLPALPLDTATREQVGNYSVDGIIHDLSMQSQGDPKVLANWSIDGQFSDFSFRAKDPSWPSFTRLSGRVKSASQGQYDLMIDAKNTSFTFPDVFKRETMDFTSLQATARLSLTPQLKIEFSQFSANNEEAHLAGKGYWADTGDEGTLNISGKILHADATSVKHYLPLVVGTDTLEWLDDAILAGTVTGGSFEVKGPLHTFPWHKSTNPNEHFLIEGTVEGGKLNFFPTSAAAKGKKPAWPLLTDIKAHLIFEGNGMRIEGSQVQSHGLTSNNAVVKIDNFLKPVLDIDGDITGDVKNALGYLKDSEMLADILGGAFDQSTGSGALRTKLSLSIPLSTPESTTVSVLSSFNKAKFSYGFNLPEVKDLTGELLVTETQVSTPTPLTGKTVTGPVTVTVNTEKKETHIAVNGSLSAAEGLKMLGKATAPLSPLLTGTIPVAVDVAIGWETPGFRLSGKSSLDGLESTLPSPLAKAKAQAWTTTWTYEHVGDAQGTLRISAPEHAEVVLDMNPQAGTVKSGLLALGTGTLPTMPKSGFLLAVTADDLDLDAWQKLLPNDKDTAAPLLPVDKLALRISNTLHVHERDFHQAKMDARLIDGVWAIGLDSQEVAGSLNYRPKSATQVDQLSGTLTRLFITTHDKEEDGVAKAIALSDTVKSSVDSLPDLMLTINDLRYNERKIGSVSLDAKNEGHEIPRWYLRSLKVLNAGGLLDAHGVWYVGEQGKTNVTVNWNLTDSGKLLSSLHYPNAVRGAAGKLTAQLSWMGSPIDVNARTLDGTLNGDFGQGEFLQIEPGAGRILSLLSLQHLIRRLTLDFRDVLGTGFAFDSLHVEGSIAQGHFHAPKLSILGSAASVLTAGDIDLVAETLDLKSVVLPSINAGGPSLALALVNPAIGIGTFVSQWVFQDQISQLFKSEYAITGTFDDPVINKINSTRPSSE